MNKLVSICLIGSFTLLLSSCFQDKDQIQQAKQQLGVVENTGPIGAETEMGTGSEIGDISLGTEKEDTLVEEPKEFFTWEYLGDEEFISLDDLDFTNLYNGELEIKGKVQGDVNKIVVDFKNESSEYPDDNYELTQFKSGDSSFVYRAFSRYETLDYGENIYIIHAYSGDRVSKIQLTLLLEEESENTIVPQDDTKVETIFAGDFPVLEKYGNPIEIGKNKVSYSDVKGLEIEKINPNLMQKTCDADEITTFLTGKLDSWFYWNTCRDIATDKGVSFYTVSLDKEKYIYEKHYYLFESGIYARMSLEQGGETTIEKLPELNKQLKEKNDDFSITEISDELFVDLEKAF